MYLTVSMCSNQLYCSTSAVFIEQVVKIGSRSSLLSKYALICDMRLVTSEYFKAVCPQISISIFYLAAMVTSKMLKYWCCRVVDVVK